MQENALKHIQFLNERWWAESAPLWYKYNAERAELQLDIEDVESKPGEEIKFKSSIFRAILPLLVFLFFSNCSTTMKVKSISQDPPLTLTGVPYTISSISNHRIGRGEFRLENSGSEAVRVKVDSAVLIIEEESLAIEGKASLDLAFLFQVFPSPPTLKILLWSGSTCQPMGSN